MMSLSFTHPQYNMMTEAWQLMMDSCASESYMHGLGERYIPRLGGQTDAQYTAYINRASFVAFTKRTLEAFHGMVMRKSVHIDGFKTINVDGKGSTLDEYVSNLVKAYLKFGRCGTLVDTPNTNGEILSVANAIEKNIYPRLSLYSHSNILDWNTKTINNVEVLSYVKLREIVDVMDEDHLTHDEQYRYRVLDLVERRGKHIYRQRIYDNNEQQVGEDIYPKCRRRFLTFIPFYVHGGLTVQYPPLLSIAEQNKHHYMLDADLKHGLHFVAIPTPWCAGVPESEKPKSIGPTTIWSFEDPQARCGMLEFTGAGLAQIREEKQNIVEIIVTLASRVIAPEKSSNDESALAASIRSNSETSSLAGMIDSLSGDLTNAIRTMVWWSGGRADKVNVGINKDFMPSNLSGTDVLSYVTAWIKGSISYQSLFWVLKKGEIIKGDRTLEDELKDITDEQKKRAQDELDKQENLSKIEGAKNTGDSGDEEDGLPKLDRRIK